MQESARIADKLIKNPQGKKKKDEKAYFSP